LALLLADDLESTLELLPIPGEPAGQGAQPPAPAAFADYLLGMWAFSTEIVRAVEALVAPTLPPPGQVAAGTAPEPDGPLLR
jgi:hypothetical protein